MKIPNGSSEVNGRIYYTEKRPKRTTIVDTALHGKLKRSTNVPLRNGSELRWSGGDKKSLKIPKG